jgi:diguanylate cyclase (GGDEF)-like protein
LKPEQIREDSYDAFWLRSNFGGRWQGEVWKRRKDHSLFLAWETISVVYDRDGEAYRYVSVFSDITEARRKDEALRHFAYHDPLTGLPNRLLFEDRLNKTTALAAREDRRLAVMLVDLDHFKPINDTLGHQAGDVVLQAVGRRLVSCIRRTDTAARLGGDEFVVILDNPTSTTAVGHVAENIVNSLSRPIPLEGTTVMIGASVGVSLYPFHGTTGEALLRSADSAMYAAKAAGKGCYRFFDAAAKRQAAGSRLEKELWTAIVNGELELHYQPMVSLETGKVSQCEALVRWRHATRGLLLPGEFLPLAESSGLVIPLTESVLAMVCQQISRWHGEGLPRVAVAVNLSARNLQEQDLADKVGRLLHIYQIEAELLHVELAEETIASDPGRAIEEVTRLHDLGVHLALDHFGKGYSSLGHLQRLPIDSIKIDRSFVRHLETADDDAEIVRNIVSTGRSLGLMTVGEGVETKGQEAFLKACGCSCIQGYLHSRPLPAKQFTTWLEARNAA